MKKLLVIIMVVTTVFLSQSMGAQAKGAEGNTKEADVAWQLVLSEDKVVRLEFLLSKREERVRTLEAEREQLLLEKEGLAVKVGGKDREIGKLFELLREERVRSTERSDRQEQETEVLAMFLAQLATGQRANPNRVVPVCLNPEDLAPCSEELADEITRAMPEVQAWYSHYIGKTFEWDPVVTMQGEHSSAWYSADDTTEADWAWLPVRAEVARRLPYDDAVYLIFFKGWTSPKAVGYGGGAEYGHSHRFGFWGDFVINNLLNDENPEIRQAAIGSISHELGHALGIYKHNTDPESIMGTSAHVFRGFSEEELHILGNSSFLR